MTNWRDFASCAELASYLEGVSREKYEAAKRETPQGEEVDFTPDPKDNVLYYFFEGYEKDKHLRQVTDDMCLSCPVMKQCLEFGLETKSSGVFGGVGLKRGKVDKALNAHKSEETWDMLREAIDGPIS